MIGKADRNRDITACSSDDSHYYKFPSKHISYTVHSWYLAVTLLQITQGKLPLVVREGEVYVSSVSSKCDWSFTLEVVVLWAMEITVIFCYISEPWFNTNMLSYQCRDTKMLSHQCRKSFCAEKMTIRLSKVGFSVLVRLLYIEMAPKSLFVMCHGNLSMVAANNFYVDKRIVAKSNISRTTKLITEAFITPLLVMPWPCMYILDRFRPIFMLLF